MEILRIIIAALRFGLATPGYTEQKQEEEGIGQPDRHPPPAPSKQAVFISLMVLPPELGSLVSKLLGKGILLS